MAETVILPGIVMSVASTGVSFWNSLDLDTRWFPADQVEIAAGGLLVPLSLAQSWGITIPPPPEPMVGVAGRMVTSEAPDRASFEGWGEAFGTVATREPHDVAVFYAAGALAAVEQPDIAAFYETIPAPPPAPPPLPAK